jgi:hypothetical protein
MTMITSSLLWADLAQSIGSTVVNILAVAGGAAVGYFGTYGLVWVLCRATVHKTPPKIAQKILSALGGIACGLLVAMLLFQGEGTGWGSGGGWNLFGGSGKGNSSASSTNPTVPQATTQRTTPTSIANLDTATTMQIRMLGPNTVKGDKFYQIEKEPTAYSLEDLKPIIRGRMKAHDGQPGIRALEIIVDPETSVARNHPKVKELSDFAAGEGLTVTIPKPPGQP